MKPRIEINKIGRNDYYRYLFLEYKGRNLNEFKYKTCQEVGIKNKSELKLKFIENNFNEQNKIYININKVNKEKVDEQEKNVSNKNDENDNNNNINNNSVKIINKNNISNKSYHYEHFDNSDNNPLINVYFQNEKDKGKKAVVVIRADKSIKDLIENYLYKIGEDPDYYLNRYQDKIFIINGINLLEHLDDPISKHVSNGYIVTICDISKIEGAGSSPFDFVDVTSNKVKLKKVIYAPRSSMTHRKVKKGLNIFGICRYKNCGNKGKEVICPIGLKREGLCFNLNEEKENIICPICKTKFEKKTCGFWRCEYQFVGFYSDYEEGKNIKYNSEPHETPKDEFEYFDPDDNGIRKWDELLIFVLPRQKIKYKK